jgi:nitrite reductase/ring-hydroxylating ferredoxin subunit
MAPLRDVVVGRVEDIPPGFRVIVTIGGRSIGVFNIEGRLYAILNRCPHRGAELCKGDVISRVTCDDAGEMALEGGAPVLVCPWHGWEYDMETGESLTPSGGRARPIGVRRVDGRAIAREVRGGLATAENEVSGVVVDPRTHCSSGPYQADVVPVRVEGEYIVLTVRG